MVLKALPCEVCAELEAGGRAGRPASLYRLVEHHIDVHETLGAPVAGCSECAKWENPEYTQWIRPHLVARWRRRHHVEHELRIVGNDGPGHPLRFADMPAPRRSRERR